MGLQCSKQGHIQDFHNYDVDRRLAPEGECTAVDLTNGAKYLQETQLNVTSLNTVSQKMEKLVQTLQTHNLNSSTGVREDVLIGEENTCFHESKYVNLPPEGKVDTEKEFVELPSASSSKKISLEEECYVELPPVESSIHRVESKESMVSSIKRVSSKESLTSSNHQLSSSTLKDEKNESSSSTPVDNAWSYTLYDFQGKGIVTKQDLKQLMESISTVIGQSSSCGISKKEPKTQPFHLEITQGCSKICNVKSPNKYAPSKHYKGMIFPPPNTEEAEKVSCYIEEKLTNHRDKIIRNENSCKEYKHRSEKISKDTCKCPVTSKRSDGLYVIPKRKELCEGDEKKIRYGNTQSLEKSICRLPKSNSSFSPASMSGANTPKTIENHEREVIMHRKVPTTVTTPSSVKSKQQYQSDEAQRIRLRHSCSCHQRIRDKLKSLETSDVIVDQESKLCKQIKTAHRETLENDNLSFCGSAKSSSRSSTTSSSESSNVSTRRSSSKLSNSNSKNSNENKSFSKKSPKLLSKRYSREKAESVTNVRPAVWPGECTVKNEALEELPSKKVSKEPLNITTSTDNLCFCKRMLGLDYPCNHNSTVQHTHKHEHHHFHYYLPQQQS